MIGYLAFIHFDCYTKWFMEQIAYLKQNKYQWVKDVKNLVKILA